MEMVCVDARVVPGSGSLDKHGGAAEGIVVRPRTYDAPVVPIGAPQAGRHGRDDGKELET